MFCRGVRPLKVEPLGVVSGAAESPEGGPDWGSRLSRLSLSFECRQRKTEDDVSHEFVLNVDNHPALDLVSLLPPSIELPLYEIQSDPDPGSRSTSVSG